MTTIGHAVADHIYRTQPSVLARCLGLILSGCLVLAWAGLRLTRLIGAS